MNCDYLWEGGPEFVQSENFRFGTDSVLLGHFIPVKGVKRAIDLGCASGVLSLLMLSRSDTVSVTGLEINRDAAALAKENMARNGFEKRCEVVSGDIRAVREMFRAGSFDLVVSNPPYFPTSRGDVSPKAGRAEARGEVACTLEELCDAAGFLCRWDGRFCLVYRPERLVELFAAMNGHGIEPKRIRFVSHRINAVPSLVLVEGRRGGNPGLSVEPVLLIQNEDGTETEEIKRIYHRD